MIGIVFGTNYLKTIGEERVKHGYMSLTNDSHLELFGKSGKIDMISDQGEQSCLYPYGSQTAVVCTHRYMGNYYLGSSNISAGVYVLKGVETEAYVSGDIGIVVKPISLANFLFGTAVFEALWVLVMLAFFHVVK